MDGLGWDGWHLRNYLGVAAVLQLLVMVSIFSSTMASSLGMAKVARLFSKVVESRGVVRSPLLLLLVICQLGRETAVRGGIHACHWIWGEAREALKEELLIP